MVQNTNAIVGRLICRYTSYTTQDVFEGEVFMLGHAIGLMIPPCHYYCTDDRPLSDLQSDANSITLHIPMSPVHRSVFSNSDITITFGVVLVFREL